MAALIIGANLPDLDTLAIPLGAALTFRRGWTHGVLAMVVLPIILTAALLGWDRVQRRLRPRTGEGANASPRWLLLVSFVAVLSHPLLDWLNSYGVRLLMPFSERWFYGDSIFILDLWLLAMLGAAVVFSWRRGSARPARMALGVAAAYVMANVLLTGWLRRAAVEHAVSAGATPVRVMAGPVPLNPLRRELIYDLGDRYQLGRASWAGQTMVEPALLDVPTNLGHELVRANAMRPVVRDYLAWSRFPYVRIEEDPGSAWLHFADARFRTAAGWSMLSVRVSREAER